MSNDSPIWIWYTKGKLQYEKGTNFHIHTHSKHLLMLHPLIMIGDNTGMKQIFKEHLPGFRDQWVMEFHEYAVVERS